MARMQLAILLPSGDLRTIRWDHLICCLFIGCFLLLLLTILVAKVQVCYKKADFLADQVLLTGFAPGGLTEVPEAEFKTCSMGNTLAQELGPFGFKPEVNPAMVPLLQPIGEPVIAFAVEHNRN